MKNKKASEIKWPASVKMDNGGFMNKYAEGGKPCDSGYYWDGKKCVPKDRWKNVTVKPTTNNGSIGTSKYRKEDYIDQLQSKDAKIRAEALEMQSEHELDLEKNRLLIKDYKYPKNTEAANVWEIEKQQFVPAAHDADEWYEKWYKARMTKPEFAEVAKQRYDATVNRKTPYVLETSETYGNEGHSGKATTFQPTVSDPNNIPYQNKIFINSGFSANGGIDPYFDKYLHYPKHAKDYLKYEMIHEKSHWDENNYRQPGTDRRNIKDDEILNKVLPKEYLVPGENPSIYFFDFNNNLRNKENLEYLSRPTEVRARLNRWREYNNIDPLKNYTPSEIQNIINKNVNHFKENPFENIDDNILQLYNIIHADPNILKTLNDKYVSNDSNKDLDTAKNGGSIKWSASTKMNNGGFINKFVAGGQPPCGPGETVDPKTGLCIKTIDLPEVDVYSKASTRKLQGSLTDKLQQMRTAFQNSRARNMEDGDKYNFGLNLGNETNDVKELPNRIQRYKQAIELEKTKYAKDSYTLNQLKQYDPQHWDLKDQSKRFQRKPYEARSAEGLAALRSAVKSGAMSQEDFNYAYNDWGKHVDQNAVQGTGPGSAYNNKDVNWDSKEMNKFTKGVAYGANALTLGMGAIAAAPIVPLAANALSSGITAATPIYEGIMSTPLLGTASPVASSVTAGVQNAMTAGNLFKLYGAGKSVAGLVDGSTYDANKKVVTDAAKGEFNVGNVANALGKDLGLLTLGSKFLPGSDYAGYIPKAAAKLGTGHALESPYSVNTIIKGAIDLNKKFTGVTGHKNGGIVRDILIKYPNFNIHNNALDIYLNGGSVT
jgi:hypothetical protein